MNNLAIYLVHKVAMNVRNNSPTSNGCFDKRIKLKKKRVVKIKINMQKSIRVWIRIITDLPYNSGFYRFLCSLARLGCFFLTFPK